MYGAICGDIIGSKFEFDRGGKTKDFELFTDEDRFTDDTAMTVAIAEGLMNAGKDAGTDDIKQAVIKSMRDWGHRYPNAGYDLSESLDDMRKRHKMIITCQDSLPKALKSFFEGESYEDVVRNAVSLGGDTDTLGAIAGSMAEAFYGIPETIKTLGKSYLPNDMLEVLNKFDSSIQI